VEGTRRLDLAVVQAVEEMGGGRRKKKGAPLALSLSDQTSALEAAPPRSVARR
jgi:hypothetical protein